MEIRPILSTLRRHRITALLVVMEIALTCAIVCNAVFLVTQRLERMQMPSGVAEKELVSIRSASIGTRDDGDARIAQDIAALRQVPGVKSITMTNQIPFGNSSWNSSVKLAEDQKQPTLNATNYYGEHLLETLGTQLVAGRYFTPDEYVGMGEVLREVKPQPHVVIITQALAARMWPGESPLGKLIYGSKDPVRVVGVVASLVRPSMNEGGDAGAQWSMVYPIRMTSGFGGRFVLRASESRRDEVLKAAVAALRAANPKRVILKQETFEEVRANFFRSDRTMASLLVGVCIALLIVTALGIVGLASFWVAQRRRMIGVRRALGATRGDILRYFQTENFLLAAIGIVIGMLLAWGINLYLMRHYEVPRLPWMYLPIGALCLWLVGQIGVLGPALRAANVPPVVATRSV